jgi:hypothetical protein
VGIRIVNPVSKLPAYITHLSLSTVHTSLFGPSQVMQLQLPQLSVGESVGITLSKLSPAPASSASYSEGVRSCPPVTASMMMSSTLLK